MKIYNAVIKIPAHNDASSLQSGLRGNCLPQGSEALKSGLKIPVQEELSLAKLSSQEKLKVAKESLLP